MPPSVRCQRDREGVATIWFDVPGKSVNAVSSAVLDDLDAVLRDLEAHPPTGVIFASAKPGTFIVGGDLFEIRDAAEPALDAFLAHGQGLCDRIAALGVSTVAALSGDALGGGYELALACRHRVVADDSRIRIGLPETAIGIIPGWGGTLRLPRLVGVEVGLDLLATGRTVGPREALEIGMVDEVVAAGDLTAAARRRAVAPAPAVAVNASAAADLPACAAACDYSRAVTRARSGDHLPAPLRIVDVVEISYRDGLAAGAAAERATLIDLRRGSAGRNLMRLFFLRSAAKKVAARLAGGPARDVSRAVVVGGRPAAGIAAALARAGVEVHVVAADGGSTAAIDRAAVAVADLVVAAIDESLAVARDVFTRLDALARPDAVLAGATASLAIADLATATRHPERVIGLHLPATGTGTPLVEVVRAERSAADAVATGVGLAARLGKTPIVVADTPGFVVYRIVFRSLHAAAALFDEGIPAVHIDAAARSWGMARGPLAVREAIGRDESRLISAALATRLGDRFAPAAAGAACTTHGAHAPDDVVAWLVDPMVDEARRLLAEGVVASTDTLDLATVLGCGFPGFRGGLATFAGLTG